MTDEPDTRSIAERMVAVMRDVGAIAKNQTADAGQYKYRFRGIDQVMNAMHPALVEHGVIILPEVRSIDTRTFGPSIRPRV